MFPIMARTLVEPAPAIDSAGVVIMTQAFAKSVPIAHQAELPPVLSVQVIVPLCDSENDCEYATADFGRKLQFLRSVTLSRLQEDRARTDANPTTRRCNDDGLMRPGGRIGPWKRK